MESKLSVRDNKLFMVVAVLVIGTISSIIPSSFAQEYYQQYEDPYTDPYAKDHKKTSVNVQKIHCTNENTNIDGVDINQLPPLEPLATAEAQQKATAVATEAEKIAAWWNIYR